MHVSVVVTIMVTYNQYMCSQAVMHGTVSDSLLLLLLCRLQEAATGRVIMDDISAAALDALLHYLYGGCSRLQPAITIELFAVADKYSISGLKAECILNMQQCLEVSCGVRGAPLSAVNFACLSYLIHWDTPGTRS